MCFQVRLGWENGNGRTKDISPFLSWLLLFSLPVYAHRVREKKARYKKRDKKDPVDIITRRRRLTIQCRFCFRLESVPYDRRIITNRIRHSKTVVYVHDAISTFQLKNDIDTTNKIGNIYSRHDFVLIFFLNLNQNLIHSLYKLLFRHLTPKNRSAINPRLKAVRKQF